MRLSSQNLPDIENVSESDIDRAFENGAIGNFGKVLGASNDSFIQAGDREPLPVVCRRMIRR